MPSQPNLGLVAFRILGAPVTWLTDAIRQLQTASIPSFRIETAILGDTTSGHEVLALASHILVHREPQGLGRTNNSAIAMARVLNADALVILDGDGVYADSVEAVSAVLSTLANANVVVGRQSRVSLPIADRPGEDRVLYEHFERWLLERRFGCTLPEQLQPGLYAFDREALSSVELHARHFAADWEIGLRSLQKELTIAPSKVVIRTNEQLTTSFHEIHQREKLLEIFGLLGMTQADGASAVAKFTAEFALVDSDKPRHRLAELVEAGLISA